MFHAAMILSNAVSRLELPLLVGFGGELVFDVKAEEGVAAELDTSVKVEVV
jgi:hypothetical protein